MDRFPHVLPLAVFASRIAVRRTPERHLRHEIPVGEEIKIRAFPMQHEIRAGDSREAAGELTVLGVLIGKFARVEHGPDLLPVLTVTGPEKLRLTAFNEHLEPQRTVLDRPAGVRILRLFTVAKPQHRESRAAERVAPIFPQIRVVHVVVVEHEAGAVFIHFRGELHLGGDLRMYAREFPRKEAHPV